MATCGLTPPPAVRTTDLDRNRLGPTSPSPAVPTGQRTATRGFTTPPAAYTTDQDHSRLGQNSPSTAVSPGSRTATHGLTPPPATCTNLADTVDVLDGASVPTFEYDSDDDDDTEAAAPPAPSDLDSLFGRFRANPAAIQALHARYPGFRAANVTTFADIVTLSDMYAPRKAIPTASAHATAYFATHPRLDKQRITDDTAMATRDGIDAYLANKAAALAHLTLQPVGPLQTDPRPDLPSIPPRPPLDTMDAYHALPQGARIHLPPAFMPNGGRADPIADPGYELAKEYIFLKDHKAGRSSILPLATAQRLFAAAGKPLHSVPYFITNAVGKDEGRLVVDVTRGGLNSPEKRALLTSIYGPIIYPRTTDFCRLYCTVRATFPDEPLVMYKADYEGWFKRVLLDPTQAGLLVMVFHIDGVPHAVIPHVGQFGCQEFNYAATQASAFIYARVRDHQLATYGTVLQHVYSDDNVGCCPDRVYLEVDDWTTANAAAHAGTNAQPPTKKEKGQQLTALGALYDITDPDNPTVGLSEALVLKLVRVLFVEFPIELSSLGRTHVPLRRLQRLGSYLTQAADFLLALRPYTAGVYANTCGRRNPRESVRLTHRTVADITSARALVYAIVLQPDWMRAPMWVPPLTRRHLTQTPADLAAAQMAMAHAIVTTDARGADGTDTWGGGAYISTPTTQCAAWLQHELPTFSAFLKSGALSPDEIKQGDQINLYEAIEVVLACHHLLANWKSVTGHTRPPHVHIHVQCDNTSAIAWLTKYKHRHPLITYILHVWAQLQCKYRATITLSHLAGRLNVIADAISRAFNVPDGPAIRAWLRGDPVTDLPAFWHDIDRLATNQRAPLQSVVHDVLSRFI